MTIGGPSKTIQHGTTTRRHNGIYGIYGIGAEETYSKHKQSTLKVEGGSEAIKVHTKYINNLEL